MSERFEMSSSAQGPSYRGLFMVASASIATAVMLLPIDLLSRAVLLVWSLMVVHMLISIKKMLRADEENLVRVRGAADFRASDHSGTFKKSNNVL